MADIAFSASVSQLDSIIRSIKSQEEHHRKVTFQEEFLAFLKRHRIEFDERYLWA
jgi:hypothetical protein